MRRIEVDAIIDNGWFAIPDLVNRSVIQSLCKENEGLEITLVLEKKKSKRTAQANNYHWGVLIPGFQREWGMTKYEIYRILGEVFRKFRRSDSEIEFLKKQSQTNNKEWDEEKEWYIKSSSDMNVFEFWQYCERVTLYLIGDAGGHLTEYEGKKYVAAKALHEKTDKGEETG